MNPELIAVLDLGTTKAACLVASPSAGGIEVLAAASVACAAMPRGAVEDVGGAAAAISAAVSEAESQLRGTIDEFTVGISGGHLKGVERRGLVQLSPPSRPVTREDVLQVVNHSRQLEPPDGKAELMALPREFSLDGGGGVVSPVGLSASRLEAKTYVLYADSVALRNAEAAVAGAGKSARQFVAGPVASGLGVLTEAEMQMGALCVDLGGGTTDVAAFARGALLLAASLPLGANHVTGDLASLLRTSTAEAERLKLRFGAACAEDVPEADSVDVIQLEQTSARPMQRRVLCEIIESRMREIADHVARTVAEAGLMDAVPGGVVITGGGALLPGAAALFKARLGGLSVRLGRPSSPLPAMPVDGPPSASFAAAVGLARYALQSADDELSPAMRGGDWRSTVRTLWSLLGNRA